MVVAAGLRIEMAAATEQRVAPSTHLQGVAGEIESLQGASEVFWAHLFVGVAPEGVLAKQLEAARGLWMT